MKKKLLLLVLLLSFYELFSQNFMKEKLFSLEQNLDYNVLLENYKKNSSNKERAEIKLKSTQLSYQQQDLKYAPDFTLSSGSSTVVFDKTQGTYVKLNPSATLKIPGANNLVVSAKTPTKIGNSGISLEGADVKLGADLVSPDKINQQITLLENNRNLLLSEQNVKNQDIKIETEFLQELSDLYKMASSILSQRESYLEKMVNFETIKVQGYTKSSSKYKIAELEKKSAYNDCEKSYRELKYKLNDFAHKCGVEMEFLMTSIPNVDFIDFDSYEKENFASIESALYKKQLGELKRSINKTWTLSGSALYGYDNNSISGIQSHNVGAEISGTWKGLGAGVGFAVPVTSDGSPSLSFNLSYSPSAWKNTELAISGYELDSRVEDLDVQDAYDEYVEKRRSLLNQKENIEWEYALLEEQNKYYGQLQKESETAYKRGLLTETDFIKADNQYLKMQINLLNNLISKYKYNLEIQQLFVQ